jgi:holo-[acyl-carrier protein] synthase
VILGLGVDLCPVDRLESILNRHGKPFLDRVFTDQEQRYAGGARNNAERLAARFAAKEAVIKALGGPTGLRWRDMEVEKRENGAPRLALHGAAKMHAEKMGVTSTHISISHAGNMAVAVVVLEGEI